MSTVEPKQPDRSLAELIGDMTQGLSTLMRQEMELAKEEIQVEVQKASKAGQAFGVAAGAGLYAGFALVITLGLVLDTFLWAWLAFLVVTLVLGAVAAVFALQGRDKVKQIDPKPEATMETLQEDAQWLTEQRN
jgi:F0F1-type ATP synthase assembly protein I